MSKEDHVLHVNDETFEQAVINSEQPVLVDFWAPWCGPCHMIAPTIEELAKEYKGRVRFAKINVDEAEKQASAFDVMSIPTIMIFRRGKPIKKMIGVQPKAVLEELIEKALGEPAGS